MLQTVFFFFFFASKWEWVWISFCTKLQSDIDQNNFTHSRTFTMRHCSINWFISLPVVESPVRRFVLRWQLRTQQTTDCSGSLCWEGTGAIWRDVKLWAFSGRHHKHLWCQNTLPPLYQQQMNPAYCLGKILYHLIFTKCASSIYQKIEQIAISRDPIQKMELLALSTDWTHLSTQAEP